MRWSYKTIHYELKKDGILGSTFLDESEIELSLNQYGKAGWELVSLLETLDGLIAVFKQPLSLERRPARPASKPGGAAGAKKKRTVVKTAEPDVDLDLSEESVAEREEVAEAILLEDIDNHKGSKERKIVGPKSSGTSKTQADIGLIRIE